MYPSARLPYLQSDEVWGTISFSKGSILVAMSVQYSSPPLPPAQDFIQGLPESASNTALFNSHGEIRPIVSVRCPPLTRVTPEDPRRDLCPILIIAISSSTSAQASPMAGRRRMLQSSEYMGGSSWVIDRIVLSGSGQPCPLRSPLLRMGTDS